MFGIPIIFCDYSGFEILAVYVSFDYALIT